MVTAEGGGLGGGRETGEEWLTCSPRTLKGSVEIKNESMVDQISPSMPNVTWGWDQQTSIFNRNDALWCMWNHAGTNVGEEENMNERLNWEQELGKAERPVKVLTTEALFKARYSRLRVMAMMELVSSVCIFLKSWLMFFFFLHTWKRIFFFRWTVNL